MFSSTRRFNLSILVLLFTWVTQVFSTIHLDVVCEPHSDGSYSYQGNTGPIPVPSRNSLKAWAKTAFDAMETDADHVGIDPPGAMAALFVFTSQTSGIAYLQSSIKGQQGTSVLTQGFLNTCVGKDHRTYGNCAEIGAMAVAKDAGKSLKGAYIAIYGLEGNTPKWVSPCVDAHGYWGCGSYCSNKDVIPITKRTSRIEGGSSSPMLARAAPKAAAPKSSAPKSSNGAKKTGKATKHTIKVDLN